LLNKNFLIKLAVVFLIIDCALVAIKLTQNKYGLKHTTKPKPIHKIKPNYKYSIYFTSDDGPLKTTPILNQIVSDYEFPLTVFLVGRHLNQNPNRKEGLDAYRSNPYIYIGNHSFSHANFHYRRFYKDANRVIKDFKKNEEFLNITSKIARFPGRNVWDLGNIAQGERDAKPSAKLLASTLGYKTFGWDYELRYYKNGEIKQSALSHYNRIKKLLKDNKTYTKNQIVILMHDQMFSSQKSQEVLGELVLLLQNDNECKLKLLKDYKTPYKKIKVDELRYVKAK